MERRAGKHQVKWREKERWIDFERDMVMHGQKIKQGELKQYPEKCCAVAEAKWNIHPMNQNPSTPTSDTCLHEIQSV